MDKPGYNYEAGHIAFGPDGYLYIATGDSVRDPATEAGKFAQDTFSPAWKDPAHRREQDRGEWRSVCHSG